MSFPEPTALPDRPPGGVTPSRGGMEGREEEGRLRRVGLDASRRVVLTSTLAALFGFLTGSYTGGQRSSLQYLAENAHRLPRTVQGWYFYHKRKNYRVMLGGI